MIGFDAFIACGIIIVGEAVLLLWALWCEVKGGWPPPSPARQIAKWAGLVVCVVILGMWAVSGWRFVTSPVRDTGYMYVVNIENGFLLTVAAIPTAILWRRDRRPKPGCCQTCGYDLRASKKTCPECGTAIAPEPR